MSKHSSRGAAWQAIRLACLERDGYVCAYCGREANEADHVIPVAAGGKDELSNLVASCKPCNGRKSDRMIVRLDWVNRSWLSHV